LFIIWASSLLLAGCCTAHHVTQWEYKVVQTPPFKFTQGETPTEWRKDQEALMNDLGKDGWVFVSQSDQVLYFKRPIK
jgi:hypothetical protein